LEHRLSYYFKKHGIKVTSHDFRKTKATNLHHQGEQLADIAMYMGHSNLSTTEGYIQLRPDFMANKLHDRDLQSLPKATKMAKIAKIKPTQSHPATSKVFD
jgi:integrase